MSKYTVELRWIIENEKQFPPSDTDLSLTNILKNYPLQNADKINPLTNKKRRDELNDKIIGRYYFREIGFETVPMFLYKLQTKLNTIMTLYNQRYESIDFEFNPLWNVDMTETFEHSISGTGTTTSTGTTDNTGTNTVTNVTDNTGTIGNVASTANTGTVGTVTSTDNTGTVGNVTNNTGTNTGENLTVESDTPQSGVTEADIKANTYASKTNYSKPTSNTTNDTTATETLDTNVHTTNTETLNTNVATTNTQTLDTNVHTTNTEVLGTNVATTGEVNVTDSKTESFTRREFGSSKGYTFAQNIDQWRNIMLNVDLEIINELNDLFMNVW